MFNPFELLAQLRINVSSNSAQRSLGQINRQLDEGTKKAKGFADAITFRGRSFAAFVVASTAVTKLTSSLSKGFSEAVSFEKELGRIAQTTDKSLSSLKRFSNQLRTLSVDTAVSSTKIAELTRIFAQTGLTLRDSLKAARDVARTDILATFTNLNSTAEGAVAILSQFKIGVNQLDEALAAINVTSKRSAVEADNLIDAVKRAGGVFSSLGGDLNQFLAIFTTVRETTRESSEAIATGLRTVFSRLQRRSSISFFRELGIEIADLEGNIKGPFEAIQAIGEGLASQNIRKGTVAFAEVVEELGGIRQASRVIPILTELTETQKNYNDILNSELSINKDLETQRETLAFRLDQLRQKFNQLVGEIVESKSFQELIDFFISGTEAVIKFTRAIKELIPILITLFTIRLGISTGRLLRSNLPPGLGSGRGNFATGFNRGGFVPGVGNTDTVPAMLTPGEFVINKQSARKIGYGELSKLNRLNKGGVVRGYQDGGVVDSDSSTLSNVASGFGSIVNLSAFLLITGRAAKSIKSFAETITSATTAGAKYAKQFNEARDQVILENNVRKQLVRQNDLSISQLRAKEAAAAVQTADFNRFSSDIAQLATARDSIYRKIRSGQVTQDAAQPLLGRIDRGIARFRFQQLRLTADPTFFSPADQSRLNNELALRDELNSSRFLTPQGRRSQALINRRSRLGLRGSAIGNTLRLAGGRIGAAANVTANTATSFASGVSIPAIIAAGLVTAPFAGIQKRTEELLEKSIASGSVQATGIAAEANIDARQRTAGVGIGSLVGGAVAGGAAFLGGGTLAAVLSTIGIAVTGIAALVGGFDAAKNAVIGFSDFLIRSVNYLSLGFFDIETFAEEAARIRAESKAAAEEKERADKSAQNTQQVIDQINARLLSSFAELNVAVERASRIAVLGDIALQVASGSATSNIAARARTGDRSAILAAGRLTGAPGSAANALRFSNAISDINDASRRQVLGDLTPTQFAEIVTSAAASAGVTENTDLKSIQEEGIQGIIDKIQSSLDSVAGSLFGAADQNEKALGNFLAVVNKSTEALVKYNDGVIQAVNSANKQKAFFEDSSVFGTTSANLRNRTTLESNFDVATLRRLAVITASQRRTAGVASARSGGSLEVTQRFGAADTLLQRQVALLNLDIKLREESVSILKEQLEIEKQRAANLVDLGADIVFGDVNARNRAFSLLDIGGDTERAFQEGGAGAALRTLQAGVRNRGEADAILGFINDDTRNAISRLVPGVAGREAGGIFGNELRAIGKNGGFTQLGKEIAGQVADQFRELDANRLALNEIEKQNLLLVQNTAQILQQNLGDLGNLLVGFNDRLAGIVDSLNNATIRMTLDKTDVVVTINEGAALRNLNGEVKKSIIAEIGRNLQFGDQVDFN